jgi:hypothetical protein
MANESHSADCTADKIYFDGVEGHLILFDVVETRFQGAGVTLAGRLAMPKGWTACPWLLWCMERMLVRRSRGRESSPCSAYFHTTGHADQVHRTPWGTSSDLGIRPSTA